MTVKLPPLEPTNVQRVLCWLNRRRPVAVVAAVLVALVGLSGGITLLIPEPNGWGHPWRGVAALAVPVLCWLVLAWVQWGSYLVTFPGPRFSAQSTAYWAWTCWNTWSALPTADRGELLPVMRAVYGLGQVNNEETVELIKARSEVLDSYAAAVKEREDLTLRPWLLPGARDMEDAAAKLEMLREQNKAQRDAQETMRQAFEDLTGPGSVGAS